jgi:hypothetical protein
MTIYVSIKSAEIMSDPISGMSRGYGFVRFANEEDQQKALTEMQGVYCVNRPMRISTATPKNKSGGPVYPCGEQMRHILKALQTPAVAISVKELTLLAEGFHEHEYGYVWGWEDLQVWEDEIVQDAQPRVGSERWDRNVRRINYPQRCSHTLSRCWGLVGLATKMTTVLNIPP